MSAIPSAATTSSPEPGPKKPAAIGALSDIDAMLAGTQDQFPGYRVSLASGIEVNNNFIRFSWAAGGTPEAPLYLGGTDFVTLGRDGRFKTVAGFIDAAPAPMK